MEPLLASFAVRLKLGDETYLSYGNLVGVEIEAVDVDVIPGRQFSFQVNPGGRLRSTFGKQTRTNGVGQGERKGVKAGPVGYSRHDPSG